MGLFQIKHDIYVGSLIEGELRERFPIGFALKNEEDEFYTLRLWPLPDTSYFLGRDRDHDKFTLFSKRIETELGFRLQNPIGFALVHSELKEYIDIYIRYPRQRLFMSVFPVK